VTQDDQVRCFGNAARHLADDGVFVLECRVPTTDTHPHRQFVDAEIVAADRVVLGVGRYDREPFTAASWRHISLYRHRRSDDRP
jgi:hypothetical protein